MKEKYAKTNPRSPSSTFSKHKKPTYFLSHTKKNKESESESERVQPMQSSKKREREEQSHDSDSDEPSPHKWMQVFFTANSPPPPPPEWCCCGTPASERKPRWNVDPAADVGNLFLMLDPYLIAEILRMLRPNNITVSRRSICDVHLRDIARFAATCKHHWNIVYASDIIWAHTHAEIPPYMHPPECPLLARCTHITVCSWCRCAPEFIAEHTVSVGFNDGIDGTQDTVADGLVAAVAHAPRLRKLRLFIASAVAFGADGFAAAMRGATDDRSIFPALETLDLSMCTNFHWNPAFSQIRRYRGSPAFLRGAAETTIASLECVKICDRLGYHREKQDATPLVAAHNIQILAMDTARSNERIAIEIAAANPGLHTLVLDRCTPPASINHVLPPDLCTRLSVLRTTTGYSTNICAHETSTCRPALHSFTRLQLDECTPRIWHLIEYCPWLTHVSIETRHRQSIPMSMQKCYGPGAPIRDWCDNTYQTVKQYVRTLVQLKRFGVIRVDQLAIVRGVPFTREYRPCIIDSPARDPVRRGLDDDDGGGGGDDDDDTEWSHTLHLLDPTFADAMHELVRELPALQQVWLRYSPDNNDRVDVGDPVRLLRKFPWIAVGIVVSGVSFASSHSTI